MVRYTSSACQRLRSQYIIASCWFISIDVPLWFNETDVKCLLKRPNTIDWEYSSNLSLMSISSYVEYETGNIYMWAANTCRGSPILVRFNILNIVYERSQSFPLFWLCNFHFSPINTFNSNLQRQFYILNAGSDLL